MKKELIGIFICMLFIGNVLPIYGQVIIRNFIEDDDELDQYQIEMDTYGYIGRKPSRPYHYYIVAQNFTPSKMILTRAEVLVSKNVTTTFDLKLAIHDDLWDYELTSVSVSPDSIPTETFSWIEFDFDNIKVTPGKEYYIVCSTYDAYDNRYAWGINLEDDYPNGCLHWSEDGEKWYCDTGVDSAFKTYGKDNSPPDKPVIDGPNSGKPGIEYTFCINVTDPDGPDNDSLHVLWNWGDGTGSEWIGPFVSGMEVCDSHAWSEKGTYTIKATVRDEYGLTSTAILEIKISNPRTLACLRFADMFPVVQRILQLLR